MTAAAVVSTPSLRERPTREVLPIEEHPADGDNEDADGNQQPVERAHHAGEMIFLDFLASLVSWEA